VQAPVQQGCPAPPHVPQLPFMHMAPLRGHAEPLGVQMAFTQQPPPPQLPPLQQAWPAPPHGEQIPPAMQALPLAHARPGQQTCPAPPQSWQTPPTHAPAAHIPFAQHAVPRVPHEPLVIPSTPLAALSSAIAASVPDDPPPAPPPLTEPPVPAPPVPAPPVPAPPDGFDFPPHPANTRTIPRQMLSDVRMSHSFPSEEKVERSTRGRIGVRRG
jgi:hypothetical protein